MKPKRVEVLGVPVDCVTMEQAIQWVESQMLGEQSRSVIAINPEKVMKAIGDPVLLEQIKAAGLLISDGIGIVFAIRVLRLGYAQRVPGSELMPLLCERAALKGFKVFLFGASPVVNERTINTLREKFPGINIVGSCHGYLTDDEMPALISEINSSQAELLFVALGSPRQEVWMTQYLPLLNVKVCQGVGGTFDVIAGRVKRAPQVFRTLHLEWFYRLLAQPTRILRQTALPLFVFHVFRKRIFGR